MEPEHTPGPDVDQMENLGVEMDLWSLVASQMTHPFIRLLHEPPSGGNHSGNLPGIIMQLQNSC